MPETMRIFVTTCQPMWRVEKVLEYTIHKYCTPPFEISFLRSGDPEWQTNVDLGIPHKNTEAIKKAGCWNIGRDHPTPYSREGWATPFTCFRFAIPELCQFEGRAFHLDADFIIQRDLRNIFETEMTHPVMSPHLRTDFMLIDCSRFLEMQAMGMWPSIEEMKVSGASIDSYRKRLENYLFIGDGPLTWESWDGENLTDETFSIHYTEMRTQPWKPFPEYFDYPDHPNPKATYIFWEEYAEALEAEARGEIVLSPKDKTPPDKTPLALYHSASKS
jgi:hypothetical protein